MYAIKFKRFTRPHFLTRVGRGLLDKFFTGFAAELAAAGLTLPSASLPDHTYFQSLAALLMSPEALPERLTEALFAIDELAGPEGQERLAEAVAAARLDLALQPESSGADLALQVWLAAPELVARKHNEQRLLRLTVFEYFGATPAQQKASVSAVPNAEAI